MKLTGAHLERADLAGAHLEGAYFEGTYLNGARFAIAYLGGANLEGARGLTFEQIDWAIGDEATVLPQGLARPAAWSKSIEEQTEVIYERL